MKLLFDQRFHSILLSLFALLIFVPGLVNLPVIDRDEAHFAQATRQMMQTGHYFQIRFQDKTRFQKPPGINWLQTISVKLLSQAERSSIWPYRIPSVLSALLSVLLLYFFVRSCGNRSRTAVLAAALLASGLLMVIEAHMAVIDASLLSSVVLMQRALWSIYKKGMHREPLSWGWPLCFWLAMAYGMVLKGVTPLIGLLSILMLCLVERRIYWLRGLRIGWGLFLFVFITLAWVFQLNAAENCNYLLQMFRRDLLPKLEGGHESHGGPPLFHLLMLPITFWPASLFLGLGATYAYFNRHQTEIKFLCAWILPTWLFFEMMPTKLPQYVLPTFPAIAWLCALAIEKANRVNMSGLWLHVLQLIWGILSLSLACTVLVLPFLLGQGVPWLSVILFVIVCTASLISMVLAWRALYYWASVAVLLLALVVYPLLFAGLLPQLEPIWLARNAVKLLDHERISNENPLLVVGFSEPSLVFHLNTQWVKSVGSEAAEAILKADPAQLLLIDSTTLHTWIKRGLPISIQAHTKGYHYTKGKWVELFLVKKTSAAPA